MKIAIVAAGAISARGEGEAAYACGAIGAGPRIAIARDAELEAAGLVRPFAARASVDVREGEDRATALLMRALVSCARDLDRDRPGWRSSRIGLVLGTSSGGMRTMVRAIESRAKSAAISDHDACRATYAAPMIDTIEALHVPLARVSLVLGACASSAIAIGIGARFVEEDACDLVLAGGFDAVSPFVASGFEVLRAISPRGASQPFRAGRDGMVLGEGAAVLALERADRARVAIAYVVGFGASQDASHMTAPHADGAGLATAAKRALEEAGAPHVDLVSAHATATELNDAAEARAIQAVCDANTPIFALKSETGHTLGAAGALESLAAAFAMKHNAVPPTAGDGAIDEAARVSLETHVTSRSAAVALKLSSAFGGANAALVLTRDAPASASRTRRAVFISRAVHVGEVPTAADLASRLGVRAEQLRADGLSRVSLAAVHALSVAIGTDALRGAGIVIGHGTATLETNAEYWSRALARGARFVEPRRFPYTSPNAAPGECSIAFGLTGPGFACGLAGGVEALVLAASLVSAGDADDMIVVGADDVGSMASALSITRASGACALLVTSSRAHAFAEIAEASLAWSPRENSEPRSRETSGHEALTPLVSAMQIPAKISCKTPWGLDASVSVRAPK